jgi:uncharacterized protein (DUF1778 family)
MERETKAERVEVRLTQATKSLLTHAANRWHATVGEFLISSAVRAAEDVLVSPRVFEIGRTTAGRRWATYWIRRRMPSRTPNWFA